MISQKMQDAINAQINREMYSAYLYLSMASWCESHDLPGFANWMVVQAKEELIHSQMMFKFVLDRDGRVLLQPIGGPKTEWDSSVAVFQEVLEHEQSVTRHIHELVDIATGEKDHATANFLQWFVSEQVEEEASARAVLQQVRLVGDAPGGLFLVDRELARRVFTVPAAAAE